MKRFLNLIGTLILGLTTGISIMTNINPNSKIVLKDNVAPYNHFYEKYLDHFHIYEQIKNNYCVPATLQSVLEYLVHAAPSQEEIAARVGTTPTGTFAENVRQFFESFLWGSRPVYYPHILPAHYGATTNHMLMFQSAVVQALEQGVPPVLGFIGYIPWAGMIQSPGHVVAITGILADTNPELTTYTVAETGTGESRIFRGSDLRSMIIGEGFLFLPNQRVYNFVDETMNLWVNGGSGHTINWATPTPDIISESANLFGDLGILSDDILKNATSITFPEFWSNYEWKEMHVSSPTLILDPKKFTTDSGWVKDNEKSVHWKDAWNDEAIVNLEFNQTISSSSTSLILTLKYKITGNGTQSGGYKSPHVDINMGNYWLIKFK